MTSTVSRTASSSGTVSADQAPAPPDRSIVARTVATDLALETLRGCARDLGWTEEALAVHLKDDPRYSAYVHRVLAGDKPLPLTWLEALPEDLKAAFYARRAEQLGHLVLQPIDSQADARRMVLTGLCALLEPQLPARAGAPLKVALAAPASEPRRAVR
jgi:hypothetical protein